MQEEPSSVVDESSVVGTQILDPSYPLNITYCGECTLPVEYCEYGGKAEKCRKWLEGNLPSIAMTQLNIEQSDGANEKEESPAELDEKKKQKRGGKGTQKPEKAVKEGPKPRKITLKTATRSKNKSVTIVKGLLTHGIDLKAASKFFSNRFACGCSIPGTDELVIQGDVKDKLFDIIPEKWNQINEDMIEDLDD